MIKRAGCCEGDKAVSLDLLNRFHKRADKVIVKGAFFKMSTRS